MCMRPGYLRGAKGLKKRDIHLEPWHVQENVAAILALKASFDVKAALLGVAPIPLPKAVIAFNYIRWYALIYLFMDLFS